MESNKEKYWKQRREAQLFRRQWSGWRAKAIELYGPQFVAANEQFFTQAAFSAYMDALLTQQTTEEAAKLASSPELAVNSLEVSDYLSNNEVTTT